MLHFSLTHRVLIKSAILGLIVTIGASTIATKVYAQEYQQNQKLLQLHPSLKFSAAMLVKPTVIQEISYPIARSLISGDSTKGKIQLKSKFLGSQKFIYAGENPQNVYGFWGISFKSEFQETMSIHPSALREAKKAYPYNALRLIGTLGLVGIIAKDFIDTINKSEKVSGGELVDDGFNTSDVVLIGVAATVTVVSGIFGKKHLRNGVEIFNDRQK